MLRLASYILLTGLILIGIAAGGVVAYVLPELPSTDTLRDVQLQVPLRVYTREGQLIAEFGEKRRIPVRLHDVPEQVIQAFLATEDERFFEHPGVDWQAVIRAALNLARTGEKTQGASTITMQVARNFFLSPEKRWTRKMQESLLALKMERELSKEEILELYLNKIYLGQRSYGVAAAAQVYYGKSLQDLDLPQIAVIAGLPKAPSRLDPVSNPERALDRRNYVLGRMLDQRYITREQYDAALKAPITARVHGPKVEVEAPYVAEMVRAFLYEKYGEEAYTSGYRAITTVVSNLQTTANRSLRTALLDYDRRHGYRGPERQVQLPAGRDETAWAVALKDSRELGDLPPALVVGVNEQSIEVYSARTGLLTIEWPGLSWARRHIDQDSRGPAPKHASDVAQRGDVVRIQEYELPPPEGEKTAAQTGEDGKKPAAVPASEPRPKAWRLAQLPAAEGALVAVNPEDGSIEALVGGFDFARSKFNRVTQAQRQPGSNFKPFIYSAALEAGFTPASFINDAPIVFDAPGLDNTWRPENYTGRYYGPTRLREALAMSRNLVSIRLLRSVGIPFTVKHLGRFGFDRAQLPQNLSLALGTGELTPLEIVAGYAVFANGGYRVEPYIIDRLDTEDGREVWKANPARVCPECEHLMLGHAPEGGAAIPVAQSSASAPDENQRWAERAIPPDNAWMITSMLHDVIRRGTGQRARSLGRADLAGKTGTTNDQKDAWFSGYNARLVVTTWVGFDQSTPLGKDETGSRAALPMWIDFVRVALDGSPAAELEQPAGLVTVRIDPDTGLLARTGSPNAILEAFRPEAVPKMSSSEAGLPGTLESPEQLF